MTEDQAFTAFHAVTDRPMHRGQHIPFDETHHSGVYRRVMEKRSIVNDYAIPSAMTPPHLSTTHRSLCGNLL